MINPDMDSIILSAIWHANVKQHFVGISSLGITIILTIFQFLSPYYIVTLIINAETQTRK